MDTSPVTASPSKYGEAEHTRYYSIISARDQRYNGKFFTGVMTTGIYCLPGCAARTPKPQNVCFFQTFQDAERAGLRPCKRCKPDRLLLFEEEGRMQEVIENLRAHPDSFRRSEDLAERLRCGLSKLNQLSHLYYHSTPAHLIASARIEWAKCSLQQGGDVGEVGFACGYESLSGFYDQFKKFTGMSPGDYRAIATSDRFVVAWPDRFQRAAWLAYLGRDPESRCERHVEQGFELAVNLDRPLCIRLTFTETGIEVGYDAGANPFQVHTVIARLLGLAQDLDGFRQFMNTDPEDSKLLPGGAVLRIPQTATVWDGIVWAVLGQQVNIAFAARLRSRLAVLAGERVGPELWTVPTPQRVATLKIEDLSSLQFSARKAEYLIGIAQTVVSNAWDLDALAKGPATRAERALLELRGIGPWAAHYILMRACGFMDATPLGDTGLTSALQLRFGGERPEENRTRELMKRYAPYRSLATYHLWQSLKSGGG